MKRSAKRSKLSEEETTAVLASNKLNAKRRVIGLLKHCLNSHTAEDRGVLRDVVESLGLTPADNILPKAAEDDSVEGSGEVKTRYYTKKSSNTRLRTASDEHNEVCEICERGGDLLCCDTCTLVYHLPCVRPRLNNVPRGTWSCAHCILDGSVEGDFSAARRAIRSMESLELGLASDNEDDKAANTALDSDIGGGEGEERAFLQALRNRNVGEVTISYSSSATASAPPQHSKPTSNRRYILRKTAKKQIMELGRFNSLHEALGALPQMSRKHSKKHALNTATGASATISSNNNDASNSSNNSGSSVWCTFCLDQPALCLCAFCGCSSCFGTSDRASLLPCSHCTRETHSYCLSSYTSAHTPSTAASNSSSEALCAICATSPHPLVPPSSDTTSHPLGTNSARKRRRTSSTASSTAAFEHPLGRDDSALLLYAYEDHDLLEDLDRQGGAEGRARSDSATSFSSSLHASSLHSSSLTATANVSAGAGAMTTAASGLKKRPRGRPALHTGSSGFEDPSSASSATATSSQQHQHQHQIAYEAPPRAPLRTASVENALKIIESWASLLPPASSSSSVSNTTSNTSSDAAANTTANAVAQPNTSSTAASTSVLSSVAEDLDLLQRLRVWGRRDQLVRVRDALLQTQMQLLLNVTKVSPALGRELEQSFSLNLAAATASSTVTVNATASATTNTNTNANTNVIDPSTTSHTSSSTTAVPTTSLSSSSSSAAAALAPTSSVSTSASTVAFVHTSFVPPSSGPPTSQSAIQYTEDTQHTSCATTQASSLTDSFLDAPLSTASTYTTQTMSQPLSQTMSVNSAPLQPLPQSLPHQSQVQTAANTGSGRGYAQHNANASAHANAQANAHATASLYAVPSLSTTTSNSASTTSYLNSNLNHLNLNLSQQHINYTPADHFNPSVSASVPITQQTFQPPLQQPHLLQPSGNNVLHVPTPTAHTAMDTSSTISTNTHSDHMHIHSNHHPNTNASANTNTHTNSESIDPALPHSTSAASNEEARENSHHIHQLGAPSTATSTGQP